LHGLCFSLLRAVPPRAEVSPLCTRRGEVHQGPISRNTTAHPPLGALGLLASVALLWAQPADAGDFSLLFTGDTHSHLASTGTKDSALRGTIGA
jgi:hypothetical protein